MPGFHHPPMACAVRCSHRRAAPSGWLRLFACAFLSFLCLWSAHAPAAGAPGGAAPKPNRPAAGQAAQRPAGSRRFLSVRKWFGRYTAAIKADEVRNGERKDPDGSTERFTGRHSAEYRTTIDIELGEKETADDPPTSVSWAGRTSGEGMCRVEISSEERSRTDVERVTTKRIVIIGRGRFERPKNLNRPVGDDDPDAPNGTGTLRIDLADGTYDFDLLAPVRQMRTSNTVSETHTVDGKQESAGNPPPFDGELPYGFSVNPRKFTFVVLPLPMVPTAVMQTAPTTAEAALQLAEQLQRFRFRLPADGTVLAGEEKTDYLLDLPKANWQETPKPVRVQCVSTWRFTPDGADAPGPAPPTAAAGGEQPATPAGGIAGGLPTPATGPAAGGQPATPETPAGLELPRTLTIAGFTVRVAEYTSQAANAASGQGTLVLPFPGLPQALAEIPISFTGWTISRLRGQVTTGTLSVQPQNWRWAAEPGLSFSLSRIGVDAAAPDICNVDASLALNGVFSFPALQGVTLARGGLPGPAFRDCAHLKSLPPFEFGGLQFAGAEAVLDFSTAAPDPGWVGVIFPTIGARAATHSKVHLAGTFLGLGVCNAARDIRGNLLLTEGSQKLLQNLAGTGVDVLLNDPALAYQVNLDAWAATTNVTATLPPLFRSRQLAVSDAALAVTPQGKLELTAANVAVQPPLEVDLGAFMARGIGQLSLDLSEARPTLGLSGLGAAKTAAWTGVILHAGRVELPAPVPQEQDPVPLPFSFVQLEVGLANGGVHLAGQLDVRLASDPKPQRFAVADWPGLEMRVTGGLLRLSLGEEVGITGIHSGEVFLPQSLGGATLPFAQAAWDPGGLFVEIKAPKGGIKAAIVMSPKDTMITIPEAQGGKTSAILDLSSTQSPAVGPDSVREKRWRGLYLLDATVTMSVGELGPLDFAASDAYLDAHGLTGAFAVAAPAGTAVRKVHDYTAHLDEAQVEVRRNRLVEGSVVVGTLDLFDTPIAFQFDVKENGTWQGGLDLQRGVSLSARLTTGYTVLRFEFTGGRLEDNGDLYVDGTVSPRFGGTPRHVAFKDLKFEGPRTITNLTVSPTNPVDLDFYGFPAKVSSLAIERTTGNHFRIRLGGRLVLPQMEGLDAWVAFSDLHILVSPQLSAKVEWADNDAGVHIGVTHLLTAQGKLAWQGPAEPKAFTGSLDVTWLGTKMVGIPYALQNDGDGAFWHMVIDKSPSIPLGPGVQMKRLRAVVAWGMEPGDPRTMSIGGAADTNPIPAPQRDGDAALLGAGRVRLNEDDSPFTGSFDMTLSLPGPRMILSGSPKVLITELGEMVMTWNAGRREFQASGSLDAINMLLELIPIPGFTARIGRYEMLVGQAPSRFRLQTGWPNDQRPSIEDMSMVVIPPSPAIINAFGWGLQLAGQEPPQESIAVGQAFGVGMYIGDSWSGFYARSQASIGGTLATTLAPNNRKYPIYGKGRAWLESSVRGGVDLPAWGEVEAISMVGTAWVDLRTPGPFPEYDDKWRVGGVLDLDYHYDIGVDSGSGQTPWYFSKRF